MNTFPELRMLVGIPASGKSTFARQWLEDGEVDVIVSSDELRAAITGSEDCFDAEQVVWNAAEELVEAGLSLGLSVALDATSLIPEYRQTWLRIADECDAIVYAYRCPVTWEAAMERNSKRDRVVPDEIMQRMYEDWVSFGGMDQLSAEGFVVVTL